MTSRRRRTYRMFIRVALRADIRRGRPQLRGGRTFQLRDLHSTSLGCVSLALLSHACALRARFAGGTHMKLFPACAVQRRPAIISRVSRCSASAKGISH